MFFIRRLFWVAIQNNFEYKAVYIRGEINEICDTLSRLNNPNSGDRITLLDQVKLMCCNDIFFVSFSELEALTKEQVCQALYYVPNSQLARSIQVRKYLNFIEDFSYHFAPIPFPDNQVAPYATWLGRSLKYACIINYLIGLNFFLKQNNAKPIDYSSFIVSHSKRDSQEAWRLPKESSSSTSFYVTINFSPPI